MRSGVTASLLDNGYFLATGVLAPGNHGYDGVNINLMALKTEWFANGGFTFACVCPQVMKKEYIVEWMSPFFLPW